MMEEAITVPIAEMSGFEVGGGRTTVLGGETEVVFSSGATVLLSTSTNGDAGGPTTTATNTGAEFGESPAVTTTSGARRSEVGWMVWAGVVGSVILVWC